MLLCVVKGAASFLSYVVIVQLSKRTVLNLDSLLMTKSEKNVCVKLLHTSCPTSCMNYLSTFCFTISLPCQCFFGSVLLMPLTI